MLNEIREAINTLEINNCYRKDLIITFSHLVECLLIEEIQKNYGFEFRNITENSFIDHFEGVKIVRDFPLNEIWIYHKQAYIYPELLIRVGFSIPEKKIIKFSSHDKPGI